MQGTLDEKTRKVFLAIAERTRLRFIDLLSLALSESQRNLLPEVSPAAIIGNREKLGKVRDELDASLRRLTEQGLIARTEAPVEEYRTYYITPMGLKAMGASNLPDSGAISSAR